MRAETASRLPILFRVDANATVGLGHLMRCLSVADELAPRGAEPVFICADKQFAEYVEERGYSYVSLNSSYHEMSEELPRLLHLVETMECRLLVVDSYYVDDEYLESLSSRTEVVYFDDFGSRRLPVDILVNYNVSANRDMYRGLYENRTTELLLGSSYAPLRKQFDIQVLPEIKPSVENVAILVGGADPEHMAARILAALDEEGDLIHEVCFHFVLGSIAPDIEAFEERASDDNNVVVHQGIEDMATFMCAMDAAVSASGTTLYELCACGIPTVNYCLSDDQYAPAHSFSSEGAMLFGGDYRDERKSLTPLVSALSDLCSDTALRRSLRKASAKVVDGEGSKRLARLFLSHRGAS